MKSRFWQRLVATTLITCAVCVRAADTDDAKPAAAPPNDAAAAKTPATSNTPPIVAQPNSEAAPASIIPPKLSLPPLLDQVVRLSQSGTDENVVRAYVEKAATPYQITGNEIIQLQDLGVSKSVILALIEHSKTAMPSTVDAPANTVAPVPTTTEAPPQSSTEAASDYYDALSPYGSWTDVPGYGWSWQPTVVVVNPSWRPYSDNGYWLWSDSGWYWNSYYSWGWAPFHYGRWFHHGNRGWYWCPDRVWGPAWVSWRNSGSYCGWAPLPPGACFTAGVGWTHRGVRVGVDFGFGIASAHFSFVHHGRFADRHVGRHVLRGHDANTAFAHTKVINNYSAGANNRVFNHGIGREQVAAARGTPIQTASTSELTRRGTALSRRTFTATTSTGPRNQSGIARQATAQQNRTAFASIGARSSTASSGNFAAQRPAPNYAAATRGGGQQFRNNYAAAAPRMNPAPQNQFRPQSQSRPQIQARPQVQPRYSGKVGRSAAAPRTFSPPAQRQFTAARPSFQGRASFGGGASRGNMGGGRSASTSVGRSGFAGRR